jgi:5-methyltetrahydrofolate--homocysteine methyltransferase
LYGKYPAILNDEKVGVEATKLFNDANQLIDRIINGKLLKAKAVIGFFPANSVDDDVEVQTEQGLQRFHFLRQQVAKAQSQEYRCLADYVAPKESKKRDHIGMFAVTAGIGIEKLIQEFESQHDDYNSILIKAIADRFAEGLAEVMHEEVRKQHWGYAKDENISIQQLIDEDYQGIRPAPGYPACPDHTEKPLLFEVLDVEKNAGITLTESMAMYPASSVSGFYFSHAQSKYFAVGKIDKDQIDDYAKRKNMPVSEIEKWLSPNLGYGI